jgi:peptidyl-prolyl cis-trans isomerase C
MNVIKNLLKEPLFQFLMIGGLLFFMYEKTANRFSTTEIVVNKDDLINYMQYQANGFNRAVFEKKYAELTADDKQKLIDRYSEELVLVREAEKLNLQQNDNVIKNRLIQKVKFVLKSDATAIEPMEKELQNYYDSHQSTYSSDEKYSFTHVFFSFENRSEKEALKLANDFLEKSRQQPINANDALSYSERFPYFSNYTQRNLDFIASNFAADFAENLKKMPVSKTDWQGPLKSNLGYHAVLLVGKEANAIKPFDEVTDLVKANFISEKNQEAFQEKIKTIKKQYKIKFK